MQLRITRGPTAVRIEVDDPSSTVPVQQDPDPMEDHGRGIFLVETLATSWGVEVRDDGKTVWFEIDVLGARRGPGHELSAPARSGCATRDGWVEDSLMTERVPFLPTPRGPVSAAVIEALDGRARCTVVPAPRSARRHARR